LFNGRDHWLVAVLKHKTHQQHTPHAMPHHAACNATQHSSWFLLQEQLQKRIHWRHRLPGHTHNTTNSAGCTAQHPCHNTHDTCHNCHAQAAELQQLLTRLSCIQQPNQTQQHTHDSHSHFQYCPADGPMRWYTWLALLTAATACGLGPEGRGTASSMMAAPDATMYSDSSSSPRSRATSWGGRLQDKNRGETAPG
jgi:hypothetical protein